MDKKIEGFQADGKLDKVEKFKKRLQDEAVLYDKEVKVVNQ